ncbi:MAG: phosphatidylserine decarboxylase [Gammaproteobacteria bacterium]|nr:phosphatidylserine decarboxylase [Gammaproteobacteria bacterium]|tara:strand:+ start:8692 stop:9540 length:849 start_codon:yes stop_codon:yes gene_type:complete
MNLMQNLNTLIQYGLPGHTISRVLGKLAFCEIPKVKNFLIQQFIHRFKIQMDEVAEPSLDAYIHFNAFFTRALKEGIRPLAGHGHIASPADGTVFGGGSLSHDVRLTAKGHHFSLPELFGQSEYDMAYQEGHYLTIYLSPRDYHRVHCPMDGELKHMVHVPGRLFSVNESTTTSIPAVFARNERVIMHFKGKNGPFSVVLIGAMLVASIETPISGLVTPPGRGITEWSYHRGTHHKFIQGDEIGRFQYGSTVIVVIPKSKKGFSSDISHGYTVKLGQSLGQL